MVPAEVEIDLALMRSESSLYLLLAWPESSLYLALMRSEFSLYLPLVWPESSLYLALVWPEFVQIYFSVSLYL